MSLLTSAPATTIDDALRHLVSSDMKTIPVSFNRRKVHSHLGRKSVSPVSDEIAKAAESFPEANLRSPLSRYCSNESNYCIAEHDCSIVGSMTPPPGSVTAGRRRIGKRFLAGCPGELARTRVDGRR